MEPLLYNALCRMAGAVSCEDGILTAEEKKYFGLYLQRLSVREDGGLLWDGLKIPTMDQLEKVLQPVHFKRMDWHCRDMRTLREALVERGFTMPKWLGGLGTSL